LLPFSASNGKDRAGVKRLPSPVSARHQARIAVGSRQICLGRSRVDCGNLLISVRMRAPFAPHMSFGSRATRQNLKRGIRIPSDELSRFF
jgi:hypothetical protein